MVRALFLSAIAAAMLASTTTATTLFFQNKCSYQIDLFNNHESIPIAPGGGLTRPLPDGNSGLNGMFRHGRSPEATLFEWTMASGKIWWDISIIPTKLGGQGPGECASFEECKRITGGTGFNVPMQAAPRGNIGIGNCRVVTCMNDGCPEAYHFPKNDKEKMADCIASTDFDITFCPGGPGAATTAPPPTPPPTTPAPTVEERSKDELIGGGLTEGSAQNESGEVDLIVTPTPTELPATVAPEPVAAPQEEATSAGDAAPAVEANTQSSAGGSSAAGTVFIVMGLVASAAAAAVIVVIRRKKAALEASEDKDSLSLTTPAHAL